MTKKLYLERSDLALETIVTEVGQDDRGPWIRTKQTIMHAKGGGQKADKGTINGFEVLEVLHAEEGRVNHYLADHDLEAGDVVNMIVDKAWRKMGKVLHSAGHLVGSIIMKKFPMLTPLTAQQWPGESRVVFDAKDFSVSDSFKSDLENALRKDLSERLSVKIVGDPYKKRFIQIGDYSPIPCGGTHVENLSEINYVAITSLKIKKKKLRISFDANDYATIKNV